MRVDDLRAYKVQGKKLSMITCYDYWSAKIINETPIDMVLVGDSAAMVMHGHSTTIPATVEMMVYHIEAVTRGAPDKFIIGDLPFLSFRKGLTEAMNAVASFMRAGAHAVKLEGVEGHEEIIEHMVKSGIPVMGHLGLTPQSIHQLGGFKVQGRDEEAQQRIFNDAEKLEALGCFSVVLECLPEELTEKISHHLKIPTIGIGAGIHADGQVLVLQDMLGMDKEFKPKFLKQYLNGFELIQSALTNYHNEVVNGQFPTEKESYHYGTHQRSKSLEAH